MVAMMVNTVGTGLEISRVRSTSCLDGACAPGEYHLLFFWHGEGLYKALKGSFAIVGNLYTTSHLPIL